MLISNKTPPINPCILAIVLMAVSTGSASPQDTGSTQTQADAWRAERRFIDLHEHLDYLPELLQRAIRVLDASGIGLGVDLTAGTVTPGAQGGPSEFEQHKLMEDSLFPGHWVQYMNLDYKNWDAPDFSEQAVKQVETGHRLGAAGFKEWKRLGLYLRNGKGELIKIDDPKLDAMWERLGELKMPVSIHIADPKAFFEPYNDKNERWKELKDHPRWWFGDTNKFPTWHGLLDAMLRVVARHPRTTFVCVHFGNNAEEIDWVAQALAKYPNMMVDLAARIPELGRHDPREVQKLFTKFQDRIFFATDFQSLESRMILGSSGPEPPPSEADAEVLFRKEYRWLETLDKNWEHMTPIQGDWKISSIGLPETVLRKIYFDNARRLLARSLPMPTVVARRTTRDFVPDGDLSREIWQTTHPVRLDCKMIDGTAVAPLSTRVRVLWSTAAVYVAFECPFTKMTIFDPPNRNGERFDLQKKGTSLWDRDVVEVFIGSVTNHPTRYAEFEVAPTNEHLDVMVDLPEKDFEWNSHFQSAVRIDKAKKIWTCEMRIPMNALAATAPASGVKWRINFYRKDRANEAFLAWRPTLTNTTHTPERFGQIEFAE